MKVNLYPFGQNETELGYVGVRGGNRGASSEMNLLRIASHVFMVQWQMTRIQETDLSDVEYNAILFLPIRSALRI